MNKTNLSIQQTALAIVAMTTLLGGVLTGCTTNAQKAADGTPQQSAPAATQKQVDDIKNNTHMPPAAKEAAIRALQQGQAQGAGMHQSADKAPKK